MYSKQSKPHKCKRAKCSRISGSGDNRAISCFGCGEIYYAHCFDLKLDLVKHKTFFRTTSNVQFICTSCVEPLSNYNTGNQQQQKHNDKTCSTDNSNDKNQVQITSSQLNNSNHQTKGTGYLNTTAGIVDDTAQDSSIMTIDASQDKVPHTIDLIMKKLDSFERVFENLYSKENETHLRVENKSKSIEERIDNIISHHLVSLHAKFDHFMNDNTKFKDNDHTFITKLNEISSKIDSHSQNTNVINNKTPLAKRQSSSISNRFASKHDQLNWSLSFNQSFSSNENSDLYQLLTGFEQNTWTSFDFMRDRLAEQSSAISNIESLCRNFKTNDPSNNSLIQSPVVNSINSDIIQQIRDKCEDMDKNINLLIDNSSEDRDLISSIGQNMSTLQSSLHSHSPVPSNHQTLSSNSSDLTTHNPIALNETEYFSNGLLNDEINSLQPTFDSDSQSNHSTQSLDSITTETIHDISGDHITGHSMGSERSTTENIKLCELHLSKLPTDITEDDVLHYMNSKGIQITEQNIKLHKLVKRNADLTALSFVSFKIDTIASIAQRLRETNFWPEKCVIKNFVQKNRCKKRTTTSTVASVQNFRLPSVVPTQIM